MRIRRSHTFVVCRVAATPKRLRMACVNCRRIFDGKLVLHPEKTKIVYCKDANRRPKAAWPP